MIDWPTPITPSDLRSFLGLTGFYRKFIRNYDATTAPLMALLCKDSFVWNFAAQTTFQQLKTLMTQAPILASPDFTMPFILETDASGTTIGVVLIQKSCPIAFFSKQLCPRLQRASTYVCELHAITTAVRKWRHYLLGHSFVIMTDHRSLKELMSQVIQTPEQQHCMAKLLGYDYTIQYKPGAHNVVVDALSRVPTSSLLLLFVPHTLFMEQFQQTCLQDTTYQALLQQVLRSPADHPGFTVKQNMLIFHDKLWLPLGHILSKVLLDEFHLTPIGGHMGVEKTLHRIQQHFYWPKMRQDIRHYIAECVTCQQIKLETRKPIGLLQLLPISSSVWVDLSMDFITGLPTSQGYNTIMVVVDC